LSVIYVCDRCGQQGKNHLHRIEPIAAVLGWQFPQPEAGWQICRPCINDLWRHVDRWLHSGSMLEAAQELAEEDREFAD
jgi:hypothetical protein